LFRSEMTGWPYDNGLFTDSQRATTSDTLLNLLRHSDPDVRQTASAALVNIVPPDRSSQLMAALKGNSEPQVRNNLLAGVARLLSVNWSWKINSERNPFEDAASEAAQQALREPATRAGALKILNELDPVPPSVVEPLISILMDPDRSDEGLIESSVSMLEKLHDVR